MECGVISKNLIDNFHYELDDFGFLISSKLSFCHAEQFEVDFPVVIAKFGTE